MTEFRTKSHNLDVFARFKNYHQHISSPIFVTNIDENVKYPFDDVECFLCDLNFVIYGDRNRIAGYLTFIYFCQKRQSATEDSLNVNFHMHLFYATTSFNEIVE